MELFEGFHPEREKCTWKKAADTCEKPGNHYLKTNAKMNTNHKANTNASANTTTYTIGKGTYYYDTKRKE